MFSSLGLSFQYYCSCYLGSGVVIFLAFVLPVLLLFVWVPAGAVVGSSGLFFNFTDFDFPVSLLLSLE